MCDSIAEIKQFVNVDYSARLGTELLVSYVKSTGVKSTGVKSIGGEVNLVFLVFAGAARRFTRERGCG